MKIGMLYVSNGMFRDASARLWKRKAETALYHANLVELVRDITLRGDARLAHDLAIVFGCLYERTVTPCFPVQVEGPIEEGDDDRPE